MVRCGLVVAVAVAGCLSACSDANSSGEAVCEDPVPWQRAADHIGDEVALRGEVVSAAYLPDTEGEPTFLNIGADYPSSTRLSVVVWGEDRHAFSDSELDVESLPSRTVCIFGKVSMFEGVAQVTARDSDQFTVED